jgi:hypothetical protein
MKNFSESKASIRASYALAAAFILYWRWRNVLDALPFLVVIACSLMHLFMHRGHRRVERPRDSEKHDLE